MTGSGEIQIHGTHLHSHAQYPVAPPILLMTHHEASHQPIEGEES